MVVQATNVLTRTPDLRRSLSCMRRMTSPRAPRPFGTETLDGKPLPEIVEDLAIDHRYRLAMWALVRAGSGAHRALRAGLSHRDPRVRAGVCDVYDHVWDEEARPLLEGLLDDESPRVRRAAAHALTCQRCRWEHWALR